MSQLLNKTRSLSLAGLGESFNFPLSLFHQAVERVPAYRAFLKSHGVDARKIRTLADYQQVPLVTKENYLKKYQLSDLLLDGKVSSSRIISMSSGSSGQPFFWFRGPESLDQAVLILDELLDNLWQTRRQETLVIMAFAMGTWIAGTYMTAAMDQLAARGHRLVTITPGINKDEILRIIEKIGGDFDQILLMGYPPFIKDVLDAGSEAKLNLKGYNFKLLFAGENISEKWRDYVLNKIGAGRDPSRTIAMYGTADAGIMGVESPLTQHIRRLAQGDSKLFAQLFPNTSVLPTLVQYEPTIRYVEAVNGHLAFTISGSLPLIRYDILDEGRVFSAEELIGLVEGVGYTIPAKLKKSWVRPVIALYGRPDVAAMFYALNIYPENIKYGLEVPALQQKISGKFIVKTLYDDKTQEQSLHITVELRAGVTASSALEDQIYKAIVASLKRNNSEYNKLAQEIKEKANPYLHLVEYGSSAFQINIKHRWVAKS